MKYFKYLLFVALSIALFSSCKKDTEFTKPPMQAHFVKDEQIYLVRDSAPGFELPIGLTQNATSDTKITVSVSSPTGATVGNQYTLSGTSVTIPAGQSITYLTINGNFSALTFGHDDTLVFDITGQGMTGTFNQTCSVVLRKLETCPVTDINDLIGVYANTNETFGSSPYGPYTTSVDTIWQTSPTTATISIGNIWDSGWKNIHFKLDWTDPANYTVTLDQQAGIADAGTLSSTYAGKDVSVRPFAGQTGTFTMCNGIHKITLKLQLGVTGLGWFTPLYTVIMER